MKLNGPGKYDDLATRARVEAEAEGVVLIVISGNKGGGFAVQMKHQEDIVRLPALLRALADGIEREGYS